MKNIKNYTVIIFLLLSSYSFSTGLLMPTKNNYPKDFLRLRSSHVTVNIKGAVAETIVYQEFVNEWYDSTDAVYSFPLPPNARATQFLYWYNDTVYQAVLKVKEQAVNPGTGEGGLAAEVNDYIGRNGIKIYLKGIAGGTIQKVELHYVSMCNYYKGRYDYDFPLNTGNFIQYPVDDLQFNVNVESNSAITNYDISSYPDFKVESSDANSLHLQLVKPKAYLDKDFQFYYETDNNSLGVDFYSAIGDTAGGHFILFVRPQNAAQPDSILPKRVLFLLSNSSSMYGNNLSQSIFAISRSLDLLSSKDYFNIILFNYNVQPWKVSSIPADSQNINDAKNYLSSVAIEYGTNLGDGIKECLNEIKDESYSNSILVFTNGRSPLNPIEIENLNTHKVGIFPIGIGDDLDRSRLEMTAALNYGFVTYIENNDNLSEKMLRVFNQINQPLLKDVFMEYGKADLFDVVPGKIPSTYAGSSFFIAGMYKNPGMSALSIGGNSVNGMKAYDFKLDFSANSADKFTATIWAKEMIDAIEREIDIYGETEELKQKDIDLSLKYNIRCRYTAYIADYETLLTLAAQKKNDILVPESFITGNYPNPFNPSTRIRFYLGKNTLGLTKLIKVYNILGQLVTVIDISNLSAGWHEVVFNGKNMYGQTLSSGVYFVQLQIGNKICNTIRINFVK